MRPAIVTHRRPESRIASSPMTLGIPTTSAMTASGLIRAWTTAVNATPASSPTALPISMAPASSHGRGRGITLTTLLRLATPRARRSRRGRLINFR